ncbi:hypothetical protein Pyn_06668 [Prunus yedoensis var. nudiflora]|uniref:Homeobox-leucine zipper protein HDG2 n=1 Tax=Prunus yedoensis var. nudiflora TaxID=2094558 RepID=A0A314UFD6_PRUYE|nr:hypothetical protein Pyn_06668 [Prunus yedoensis var. nudiflora]
MFQPNLMEAGHLHPLDMAPNTSENDIARIRDDDFDRATKSGDDQDPHMKKKRHRHTLSIRSKKWKRESFFKECPHPDYKKRKELSRELGLEPLQVKYWFQNKRNQMKTRHELHESTQLRNENENLRADNMRYREALGSASCPNCGGVTAIGEMSFNEAEKQMIIEIAVAAMEELIRMAQMGEPLWMTSLDGNTTVFNEDEYIRTFPRVAPKPNNPFKCEASRESAVVIMNHINLVEILMDVSYDSGSAVNWSGWKLQWSLASEFQVPSPLVPTRESYYVRYCKQHADGTWVVVDDSLDTLRPNPAPRSCQRRPSGCLIQEMPNGYSKVTWVEHVNVDELGVHNMYKQLVNSGNAFGAKRWVATLDRQCERLASSLASNIPTGDVGVITNQEGRKSMLKLAERMVISFYTGVSASTTHTWTTLSGTGADDVRVMTRKSVDDPGTSRYCAQRRQMFLASNSSQKGKMCGLVFFSVNPRKTKMEWDILFNGGIVQEMAHITNGRDIGNCVSLLRSANSSQSNMLILQESCTDQTASFVIYAPVDIVAMNVILVDSDPTAKLSLGSVATVNNLIACTVERIKAALSCDTA